MLVIPSTMQRNEAVNIWQSTRNSTGIEQGSTNVFPGQIIVSSSWANIPVPVSDRIGVLVFWGSTVEIESTGTTPTITVSAGTGWRRSGGNYSVSLKTSTNAQRNAHFFGPFDSAQFTAVASNTSQAARVGDPYMRFTFTGNTSEGGNRVHILPFKMPIVEYTT